MKKLLETYFDSQFIFPYMHLDDVRAQHLHYSNSNIYMVMLARKYQIVDAQCISQQLVVNYNCLERNKSYKISNIMLLPFEVPNGSIEINTGDYGTTIETGLTNCGIEFIKENHVDFFNGSNIHAKEKLSIYDLISLSNHNWEISRYW